MNSKLLKYPLFAAVIIVLFGQALVSAQTAAAPIIGNQCGVSSAFGSYLVNGVCLPNLLINMSTVVLFISFLIVAFVFMMSQFLESPRLKNWASNEFYQVLGTAVILMVYLTIVGSLNSAATALYSTNLAYPGRPLTNLQTGLASGTGIQTIQSEAYNYVNCLFNYASNSVNLISELSAYMGVLGSLTMSLNLAVTSIYIPIIPGLGGVVQVFSLGMGAIAIAAVQMEMQLTILSSQYWFGFFSVLLPLGLVLRSFSLTRPAGAAMIAIAIGFTILLPVTYLVIEDIGSTFAGGNVCQATIPNLSSVAINTVSSGAFGNAVNTLTGYFEPGGKLYYVAFRIGIEGTILPVFAYLIVLNIVRNLAEFLGGDIDLSSLVKII